MNLLHLEKCLQELRIDDHDGEYFLTDVELDCLATWKEGTKHFGIGKFSSYSRKFDGNIRDDDDDDDEDDDDDDDDDDSRRISRYRCFVGGLCFQSTSYNNIISWQ